MKKQYKKPITESVKVNLYGSVLDESIGVDTGSNGVLSGDAKENDGFFDMEDDMWDSDPWADGGDNGNSYDLWNE